MSNYKCQERTHRFFSHGLLLMNSCILLLKKNICSSYQNRCSQFYSCVNSSTATDAPFENNNFWLHLSIFAEHLKKKEKKILVC